MREEAEHAEAVVEGDEHAAVLRPLLAVHFRLVGPAAGEAAAVDPEGHGQLLAGLAGRRGPYVEVQAVLAEFGIAFKVEFGNISAGGVSGLPVRMTPGVGDQHALPGDDGLWLLPAELADGRGGEGDAPVYGHAGRFGRDALHLSALDGEDGILGRAGGQQQERRREEDGNAFGHRIGY